MAAPSRRILIIPRDASLQRHIGAVRKKRNTWVRNRLNWKPVFTYISWFNRCCQLIVAVDAQRVRRVEKPEEIGRCPRGCFETRTPIHLILVPDGFIQPRLHRVLMSAVQRPESGSCTASFPHSSAADKDAAGSAPPVDWIDHPVVTFTAALGLCRHQPRNAGRRIIPSPLVRRRRNWARAAASAEY